MRRTTEYGIIHCSATKPGVDIGAATIRRWHVEGNGWSDIGYQEVIRLSGEIDIGRERMIKGAHAPPYNGISYGICLIGGLDHDGNPSYEHFNQNQLDTLKRSIAYHSSVWHGIQWIGHRDVPRTNKDCPCFDVAHFVKTGELRHARKRW